MPSQTLYFVKRKIYALLLQQTVPKPLEHKTGIDLTVSSALKKPSKNYTCFIFRRSGLFLIHLQSKKQSNTFPNHSDDYFIPISWIHTYSTTLTIPNNMLLPSVNSSSGKCSLTFVGPKVWSSIPDYIKSSTTFTFKWKLKKHLLHEKEHIILNFSNISLIQKKILWVLVFSNSVFYVCLLFCLLFFSVHIPFFSAWKYTP